MRFIGILVIGLVSLTTSASPFGQELAPGESMVIWSSESPSWIDCGRSLDSVKAGVEYDGRFSGVVALVVDDKEVDSARVANNQNYVNLRTFGGFNVLCDDISTVALQNTGKDPVFVGGSQMFLGTREKQKLNIKWSMLRGKKPKRALFTHWLKFRQILPL